MDNAKTDWAEMLNDYNAVKSTNFSNPKVMLEYVYNEKRTYQKTGKVFLLSSPTIAKYMKKWRIPHLPKGHRPPSPCLRAIQKIENTAELTCKEICKITGYSLPRVWTILKENDIKYKKLR